MRISASATNDEEAFNNEEGPIQRRAIFGILKQHEAGRKLEYLAREHGTSEATIYT